MGTSPLSLLPGADEVERLAAEIAVAKAPTVLARHAEAVRQLCRALVAAGWGPQMATRTLSMLNDRIVARLLVWAAARCRLPAAPWCWLGFGSEARMEQTLATDQDNGLVFAAGDDSEAVALREHFLPFAGEVNRALAECGFPLCAGGIMAMNAECCLSLDEWERRYYSWVRTPSPEALLNATIYFDFRPLHGEQTLATRLAENIRRVAQGNAIFLHMMSANALAAEPPLGRLKDFNTEDDGTVDLKKHGSRLFVDASRILTLAAGLTAVSTLERLAALAAGGHLHPATASAVSQAFLAIQGLRLGAQSSGAAPGNRVNPDSLNEFERQQLRNALRQARTLQGEIKARFHVEG